ncbi:MAG: PTS sugar transporter subunit IIA [Pseudomonadota bacterium]
MRSGVLIIAHNHLGRQLLETATDMLNRSQPQVRCLDVMQDDDPVDLLARARRLLGEIDQSGSGALVLTDMYGSTPSNIAHRLGDQGHPVRVISGVNLPMLVRALNYADLPLDELAQKALSGGRDGILDARRDI